MVVGGPQCIEPAVFAFTSVLVARAGVLALGLTVRGWCR